VKLLVKRRLKQTAVIKEERWASGVASSRRKIYQLEGSSLVKRVSKRKTQADSSHQRREVD
jgi:hypothetical protein